MELGTLWNFIMGLMERINYEWNRVGG